MVSGGAAEDIIKLYPDEAKQTKKEGLEALQKIINGFAADLSRLSSEASAEATARAESDETLGVSIADEETARKNADYEINGRIDTEATTRAEEDTALGGRIDTEVGNNLKYDANTGELQLKSKNNSVISSVNLPIEMVLQDVNLIENGTKIQFLFQNCDPIELDVTTLLNPIWKNEVDDSETPPTAKAVKKYAVPILSNNTQFRDFVQVYVRKKNGSHELLPASSGSNIIGSLIIRDSYGSFSVQAPTSTEHPVNKKYFDNKVNNSLYAEVTDMERRVKSLEHAASGNIYENVCLSGQASAVQLKNACRYGIISRIGSSVAKIKVDSFYDLKSATTYSKNGPNDCRINDDGTVTIPKGRAYYFEFPCYLPAGVTITVNARGKNYKGETVSHFSVNNESSRVDLGKSLSLTEPVTNLRIWKASPGTPTEAPLTVGDIIITVNDPSMLTDEHLIYPIDEYSVPESVLSEIPYSYFDVSLGKVMTEDGEEKTVEIAEESDVFNFAPNAVIRFEATDGTAAPTDYEITYKNKIQGGNQ